MFLGIWIKDTFLPFPLTALVILEQLGELLLERGDLGPVADQDVGVVGVVVCVVLVIALGVVKRLERRDLGDDRRGEDVRRVKLRNVRLGDVLLLVAPVKMTDRYDVLCPAPDG